MSFPILSSRVVGSWDISVSLFEDSPRCFPQ